MIRLPADMRPVHMAGLPFFRNNRDVERAAWAMGLPQTYVLAYRHPERDGYVFAPPPVAFLMRVWLRRWMLFRAMCRIGIWEVEEGGAYRFGRFRWDFWRNPISWFGHRYLSKHGIAAWRAKYGAPHGRVITTR